MPPTDTERGGKDDLTLVRGEEANGVTTIVFSRPLDTGDTTSDIAITNTELVRIVYLVTRQYIQYAYHSTHDGLDGIYYIDQHSRYGSAKVNFFSGASSSAGWIDLITPGKICTPFGLTL